MTSGSLAMSSCNVPGLLRSASSSFSTGAGSLKTKSGNDIDSIALTNHKFTRLVNLRCALQTKRGPQQQQEGSSNVNTSSLNATIADQASMIGAAASAGGMPRLIAVKSLTRPRRFQAALQRVWKSRHLSAALANVAESFLTLLEPDTHPYYANLGIQLVDNFAPVAEECPPSFGLEVTGKIPECMNGVYVRNGSNPQFLPTGGYHVFDGDGMIHAVRIKDGVPSYCCRFTRTNRYLQEKEVGHALYPYVLGELTGWLGMARLALFTLRQKLGIVDRSKGTGTANAGLAFYNGKLLAISEDDMPYAIAISPDGDLHTLGRYDISRGSFNNQTVSMTAHPKLDPFTGEMFSYSYNVLQKPHVHFWRASPEGEMSRPVPIGMIKEAVLLHDFAVTENYAIIPDPIMVFRVKEMMAGKPPFLLDERKVTRFGVLPKYATDDSDMKWFDAPGSSCFHYMNAWEEGDDVVLVGSTNSPPTNAFVDMSLLSCYFTEYRMNLKTGESTVKRLSDWNLDMGRINERFNGRKSRYVYVCMAGPWPKFSGLVKVDLEAAAAGAAPEVAVRKFPPGCFGSEPFFVPRTEGAYDSTAEDDGYVVTFLHNEITNVSELAIFDARSPTLEPAATVKIPVRVPYGFHGIFLTETQLANQDPSPFLRP